MATPMSVRVVGVPGLVRKLDLLSAVARADMLERAVLVGALRVVNDAKRRAPVRTGTLRRSIHPEVRSRSATRVEVAVGTDVPYARRIEFGFMGTDRLGRRYHQVARPYLRPAFDSQRGAIESAIRSALRAQIRHLVGTV